MFCCMPTFELKLLQIACLSSLFGFVWLVSQIEKDNGLKINLMAFTGGVLFLICAYFYGGEIRRGFIEYEKTFVYMQGHSQTTMDTRL